MQLTGTELPTTESQPPFYAIGMRKQALLFVATFGLYSFHWCYENWWRVKERRNAKFNPKTRAFLAPIFGYGLFREVRRAADAERVPTAFSPVGAAVLFAFALV